MTAVLPRPFDRLAHDSLLALFDPAHFLLGRNEVDAAPPAPPPARTPHRSSSRASRASSRVDLSHLLAPSSAPSRPASTNSRPSLPPLLSLPPELLLHILHLCLPTSHDRRTTSDRGKTLCTLALVHPILRTFAQGELFHHVVLASDDGVEKLRRLTADPKGRGAKLGAGIASLRVYGSLSRGDGGKTLAMLVQQLTGLEKLHLEDLDGLEMRQFAVHPTLTSLSATRCGFRSRFRAVVTSRPSGLTHLSLTNLTAHDDAFSGFTLPRLVHLSLWDVYLPPPSPLAVLEPSDAFKALGAQVATGLKSLETDEAHFSFFFPSISPLKKCALEQLHLVKLSHLSPLLDSLPPSALLPSFRTLHLTPPTSFSPTSTSSDRASSHFSSLLAPFRASSPLVPPALAGLEELVLDARYEAFVEAGNEDALELVERAAKVGIEVRFEEGKVEEQGGRRRGLSGAVRPVQGERRASIGGLSSRGSAVRGGGRFALGDW